MVSNEFREAETAMEPDPQSVPSARRFVLDLGLAQDEETLQRLGALTSELVTNAVLHARTPFVLKVSVKGDRIRVAVTDGSETLPTLKRRGPTSPTGRGLRIVEEIADRWGFEPVKSGKTVWFELRRPKETTDHAV